MVGYFLRNFFSHARQDPGSHLEVPVTVDYLKLVTTCHRPRQARHCPVFTRCARPSGVRASRDGARGRLVKVRLVLAMALLAGAAELAMPAPAASQARGTQPRETEADA
jgi:hypothetical protein